MTPMVEQMAEAIARGDGYQWLDAETEEKCGLKRSQDGYRRRARAALAPIIAFGRKSGSLDVLTFINELEKGSHHE